MYFPPLQTLLSVFSALLVGFSSDGPQATSLEPAASQCIRPAVRKEWRTLTIGERAQWITAVKCLNKLPHDEKYSPTGSSPQYMPPLNVSSSFYDDLVYFHVNNDNYVHFTGLFFPWHRWFLHNFHVALHEMCGYMGPLPYWDWTQDADDVFNSAIFQDTDPVTGLGGWGSSSDDHRVHDGAFSSSSGFALSYPSPHTLRRIYALHPYLKSLQPDFLKDPKLPANASFTKDAISSIVQGHIGNFKGFQKEFETFQGPHAAVHLMIGGDMSSSCPVNAPTGCTAGSKWAPNEPLFWMHHAMIDKVWYDWQQKHEENFMVYEGGSVQRLENVTIYKTYPNGGPPFLHLNSTMRGDGLFPDIAISDVMNTTGGHLCYTYG